ncbi:ventrally expressed dharma/bozozok antagonist [Lepisosteus oculatus]|uniref:ventrally expressed dharma/bozozok antagonist n=1 Tax=Lepisosteus oculatus TaxID=7918 RepID=UPI0035F507DD
MRFSCCILLQGIHLHTGSTLTNSIDGDTMKGHFSVEWLSQSSQKTRPAARCDVVTEEPCMSSTPPESLPGFYNSQEGRPIYQELLRGRPWTGQDTPSLSQRPAPNPGTKTDPQAGSHALEPEIASGTEEEETSGYESEGGQSASPADPPGGSSSSPPTPPGRRPRTAFTSEQISRLERTFKKHAYLGTREKEELCRKLNLSEKQIKNWFQNRRMKLKRTLQDALAQACHVKVASQLLHYPELQAFGPSAYSGYYPNQDSTAAYLPLPGLPYAPSQALGHLSALPLEAQVHPYSVPPFVMPPHSAGTGSPPVMARYHPYAPRY